MSSLTKLQMSCARMLHSSATLTFPFTAGRILAYLLMCLILSLTAMACSGVTKSSLLRMILSAKATCWKASFTFPSSTVSSKRPGRFLESATVTTASNRRSAVTCGLDMKVRTMGTGSAMPVVSIMIWSIPEPFLMASMISCNPPRRSPRMVQHMQPLSMTTIFSANASFSCLSKASSIGTSPNSFSMMAIFLSVCSWRM
mmetsp:Transcript_47154/g.111997  ORF Transcript_47154/g.111997 Transcript_47154/m.111997 type:complete len:200 (-) Transcript_47154:455-1054(-)